MHYRLHRRHFFFFPFLAFFFAGFFFFAAFLGFFLGAVFFLVVFFDVSLTLGVFVIRSLLVKYVSADLFLGSFFMVVLVPFLVVDPPALVELPEVLEVFLVDVDLDARTVGFIVDPR